MNVTIKPGKVFGKLLAPSSKSLTHRALIIASLAKGESRLSHILRCDDTDRTIEALTAFGVPIVLRDDKAKVRGINGKFILPKKLTSLDLRDSGTSLRLFSSLGALTDGEVVLTGSDELMKRPMKELLESLNHMGINAKFIPNQKKITAIRIKGGRVSGGKLELSAKRSSQFVSSLLLISPFASSDVTIRALNLRSVPYTDITIDLMKRFGVKVLRIGSIFHISHNQEYKAKDIKLEGDFSSASYFLAAAALTSSRITVGNLSTRSSQGDKYIIDILKKMGCIFKMQDDNITLAETRRLKGIDIDLRNNPDLVPTLAAIAPFADRPTTIRNIGHLRLKESDRIRSIEQELTKMGGRVESNKDSLRIFPRPLHGTNIDPHNDHRIAMAFAIASLAAEGKTTIRNAEVVAKSYPNFWNDLKRINANLENAKV